MGFFDSKKGETITQEAMLTDEQKSVMKLLSQFASTGKFGDFKAGESYKGKLGEYDPTELEKTGQSQLMDLVKGGMPELFKLGSDEYKKLLSTDKYDPYAKGGTYSGFKKGVLQEGDEASDRLKRNLAVTGDTFSTAQVQGQGELQENVSDTLSNELSRLYQDFTDKKLAGAKTAAGLGLQEEAIKTGRIGLSQSIGSLERLLKDAQAKDKYKEYLTSRSEYTTQIDAAKSVMNKNVPYGIKSYTTPDTPSPFSQLLDTGINLATTAVSAYLTGGASMAGSIAGAGGIEALKGLIG